MDWQDGRLNLVCFVDTRMYMTSGAANKEQEWIALRASKNQDDPDKTNGYHRMKSTVLDQSTKKLNFHALNYTPLKFGTFWPVERKQPGFSI